MVEEGRQQPCPDCVAWTDPTGAEPYRTGMVSLRMVSANSQINFANVFWIGGAPDAAKSTVANLLSTRHALAVYQYDQAELAHLTLLADGPSAYRELMNATMDERWVDPEPRELFQRVRSSFYERWPFVLDDLRHFGSQPVIAEGFGLMPDLVATVAAPNRAVFLVPDEEFKAISVSRRDKPTGRQRTRDPERARRNVLQRDAQIALDVRAQAEKHGLLVLEATLERSIEDLARTVEQWFRLDDQKSFPG